MNAFGSFGDFKNLELFMDLILKYNHTSLTMRHIPMKGLHSYSGKGKDIYQQPKLIVSHPCIPKIFTFAPQFKK